MKALTYRHSVFFPRHKPERLPKTLIVELSKNRRPSDKFRRKADAIIARLYERGIYSVCIGWDFFDDPNKKKRSWSLEAKQRNRRRRLLQRLSKKYSIPQLLDSAYQEALQKNPTYFGEEICQ